MDLGKTSITPGCKCVSCGVVMNRSTAVNDPTATPSPGDLTICIYCGEVQQFTKDLQLEAFTLVEDELDPETFKLLNDMQSTIRSHRNTHI